MYTTPHAKMRFIERVKNCGLPKRHKNKFIENYLKKAYKDGLTPDQIDDQYLKDYMNGKLNHKEHITPATKITHYKNNLFLFRNRQCITVLDVPKRASDSVNNIIYVTKLHPFINKIKEKKNVKKWLHDYGSHMDNIKDLKRCIVIYPSKMDYNYVMNNYPLRATRYIKNDAYLKKLIIKTNNKRKTNIKQLYYFVCALLLILPKNQILKLQNILKNNKNSIFYNISNNGITKKQLELCYKQLFILTGDDLIPKYNNFKVENNLCYDLINDHLLNIIHIYINDIKTLFKDFS